MNHMGKPQDNRSEAMRREMARYRNDLPLRLEFDALARLIDEIGPRDKACLDVALGSPVMSHALREMGGNWRSLVVNESDGALFGSVLGDDVRNWKTDGRMPLDDRCLDIVVVGRGLLSCMEDDEALVRECHRVLRLNGSLLISVEHDKPLGPAKWFQRHAFPGAVRSGYNEHKLCSALRVGFDVLEVRSYCRFWVQLVSRWVQSKTDQGDVERTGRRAALLYACAHQMDGLLIGSRGYALLAHARRRSWRARQAPVLADGRLITEAVLSRAAR